MVRLISFIFFAFIFSCTIIEDDDITSQEDLDNLKLTSIEIEQQGSGGGSTSTARVTSEVAINIVVPGGTLTRQIWMDWPALGGNSKLKLKSGSTSAFKSYTSLLSSGKPWTFYLFSSTSSDSTLLELYSFRYDISGRLVNIITRAPYVEGGPATSNDTLIYGATNSWEVTSIIRRSADASKVGTFSLASTGGSIFSDQWTFDFQGNRYFKTYQGPGGGENYGGKFHARSASGGNNIYGVLDILESQKAYITLQDRNHNLDSYSCGSCQRYSDAFYLHPLMLLKDQLPFENPQMHGDLKLGDVLLFIYMVDWWRPVTGQTSSVTEKVAFNFKYDL